MKLCCYNTLLTPKMITLNGLKIRVDNLMPQSPPKESHWHKYLIVDTIV